ncbi:MAG: DNA methyltransferase [Rhodocyclaceae bacterium]
MPAMITPQVGRNGVSALLDDIETRYRSLLRTEACLNRRLVSFQANKHQPRYRWFKYKEGFSASLVRHFLATCGIPRGGRVLDPFAGSGTTLFAASEMGHAADGIELLPLGSAIVSARRAANVLCREADRLAAFRTLVASRAWQNWPGQMPFNELPITAGAYPSETAYAIRRYLSWLDSQNAAEEACLLRFALLSSLEEMSYTRKDGQYLRWDWRSSKSQGTKKFDKGNIATFEAAIQDKLVQIIQDIDEMTLLSAAAAKPGEIRLREGSCLEVLPTLASRSYDCIITSPPYCNRYDYTRTYALELAMLGVDRNRLSELRQAMLSCTVENRAKDLRTMNPAWMPALELAARHTVLQAILDFLEEERVSRRLNNGGIVRMVRGYFEEMACVIYEAARVLAPSAPLVMINDNVRYAGIAIPVDLILSDFAIELGFEIDMILVLPSGKGNSSQQMGAFGRQPLRKCVYIWRKRRDG